MNPKLSINSGSKSNKKKFFCEKLHSQVHQNGICLKQCVPFRIDAIN